MLLPMELKARIIEIFEAEAHKRYGLEDISQYQHALQSAAIAEAEGGSPTFILAALLHDIGHLVQYLGEHAAAEGVDNRHERLGAAWLSQWLPEDVWRPVRLHVQAKRFLCTKDEDYIARLAPDSVESLALQGGRMTEDEAAHFIMQPFADDATRLRLIDDRAKDADAQTPDLAHFLSYLDQVPLEDSSLATNGFIVLRDFFDPDEVARHDEAANRLSASATELLARAADEGIKPAQLAARDQASLIVVPEADHPRTLCRFEYIQGHDPAFRSYVAHHVKPAIEALTGERFTIFKDKQNGKPPGGGAFRPHQDMAAYEIFEPRYHVTAMLSIDRATHKNGCLSFATNLATAVRAHPEIVSHWIEGRPVLAFYDGGPKNGDITDEAAAHLEWDVVETGPADLVLFDSFVPHKSPINGSSHPRRAMFLTCNPAREGDFYDEYYVAKRARFDDPRFHVSTPTAHSAAE